MRVAICENDQETTDIISNSLNALYVSPEDITIFSTPIQFRHSLTSTLTYDLIFMNVSIDDGVILSQQIVKRYQNAIIFFIADDYKNIQDGYRLHIFQFLLRPLSPIALQQEIERVRAEIAHKNKKYVFNANGRVNVINPSDIIYLEAYHRRIYVHMFHQTLNFLGRMSLEERKLGVYGFVRIHQGFLVNMRYITCFSSQQIVCNNDIELPMSTRRYAVAIKQYQDFIVDRAI